MIKSELVAMLASECEVSQVAAEVALDTILDVISTGLANGDRIELRGFGVFDTRYYKAYQGRNPRTGEGVKIPPKILPVFKMGKDLRTVLKKG